MGHPVRIHDGLSTCAGTKCPPSCSIGLKDPKVKENLSNMTKAQYNKAMKVYEEASGKVYEILTMILCCQPAVQTTATTSNLRIIEDLKPIKMLLASMLLESFKH